MNNIDNELSVWICANCIDCDREHGACKEHFNYILKLTGDLRNARANLRDMEAQRKQDAQLITALQLELRNRK